MLPREFMIVFPPRFKWRLSGFMVHIPSWNYLIDVWYMTSHASFSPQGVPKWLAESYWYLFQSIDIDTHTHPRTYARTQACTHERTPLPPAGPRARTHARTHAHARTRTRTRARARAIEHGHARAARVSTRVLKSEPRITRIRNVANLEKTLQTHGANSF